ncbi:MAG: N-acetylmuramoyl-L-alanine amidase, partial [Rhodobacteraceae bacterium]|nr:N-acetylmuramoyl-L-alanine amidase [Paracoccaceae bacterium]
LVELGFMSSARDLANLTDPAWRRGTAEALAAGILAWVEADALAQAAPAP